MTLSVNIRRFGGLSYSVASSDLVTVTLGTSETGGPYADRVETIRPTQAQWDAFWEAVRPCRTWGREYVDLHTLDGIEWSVFMDNGEFHVQSGGANAFPENWSVFMAALRRLAGGRLYD